MNRALRAATVGVLLLTPVALTACSAGQVSQTAMQVRDKTGPSAELGDLSLRQVLIAYPSGGSYANGDDAELTMSIANSGTEDDALVGISGDGFNGVRVSGSGTGSASSSGASSSAPSSASASSSASSSAVSPSATSATASSSAPASASPGASSSASASVSAAPTSSAASVGSTTVNIPIPAHQTVFLGQNSPTVTLAGLSGSLTPGQSIKITFSFRRAGEVTLDVTVAGPSEPVARSSSFNFSQEPSAISGENR